MLSNLPQAGLALIEGFGLAFSPCILPILPFILAASASKSRIRPFLIIGGFILSFTAFSLISRQVLSLFDIEQTTIQTGAYIILLAFGLVMLVPFLEERFARSTNGIAGWAQKKTSGQFADSTLGGLMVGALIGLVWTPCAGPILATALLQVIQAQGNLSAFVTISAFSIGAGIPMLMVALFSQYLTGHLRALARHATLMRRVMGVIIVVVSVLALSGVNLGEWAVTRGAAWDKAPSETAILSTMPVALALKDGLDAPYDAPEIAGIAEWMNSTPLGIADLKGKVVLIDFWTYSCINCIRTLPHITAWAEKYKDQGLVVIGVHAPEFAFEKNPENVRQALNKFNIQYPVVLDNDFSTWKNYKNKYWPAHYLIDRDGRVVYTHFGEGHYDITENNIRYLLGLGGSDAVQDHASVTSPDQTPETYLGTARAERESSASAGQLPLNEWALDGEWVRTSEYIQSAGAGDTLTLHYNAKKVFLVMESADGKPIGVTITNEDESHSNMIDVQQSSLYDIIIHKDKKDSTVVIKAGAPGLRLYAFTFES